jgi:hypothetical protein
MTAANVIPHINVFMLHLLVPAAQVTMRMAQIRENLKRHSTSSRAVDAGSLNRSDAALAAMLGSPYCGFRGAERRRPADVPPSAPMGLCS